jgi:Na+-transporting methylmalonyl-CoA/oxaloacetate decarboxylase gamma subunit
MDWSFGLTMTFMGMGVTFMTLLLLIGIIKLLSRFFPVKKEPETGKKE